MPGGFEGDRKGRSSLDIRMSGQVSMNCKEELNWIAMEQMPKFV
jgi:hypothetical protein